MSRYRAHAPPYDCVVVGGSIREPPEFLEMFERVVNMIRGSLRT